MGKLPERTASGSIAAITDGADMVPLKSWEIEIGPDLSGKSSVVCTQTGKNLIDIDYFVQRSGYNNLSVSVSDNVLTLSGYDAGGRFGCFNIPTKIGVSYTVKYTARTNVQNVRVVESDTEPTNWINGGSAIGVNSAYTYTATKAWVQIWIEMTADNTTVTDLQVEVGSSASTFEPYTAPVVNTVSLGRTVYGGNVDVVNGTGESSYKIITVGNSGWNYYASGGYIYKDFNDKVTPTIGDTDHVLVTDNPDMPYGGVNYASQFQDLHVYQAQNKAIYIKDTSCTSANDFYAKYSDMQIGYELATPETFTFDPITPTPETMEVCNFWADTGDSTVVYRADIDALLSSLSGNRGLMLSSPQPETLSKAETEETEEKKEKEDSPEVLEK